MRKLSQFLTDDQIAKVRAPLQEAHWLPNVSYTSQDFFKFEAESLFSKTWMSIGFDFEAEHPGDAHPITVLGDLPLVMVRDEAGALRVFHNVCPHDSSKAVFQDAKGLSKIVGQYHGWVWNLDGTLRDATLFDGTEGPHTLPDRDANLKEVRSSVWNNTVFVNLSGDAAPFADYIAPVEELYGDMDLSDIKPGLTKKGDEVFVERAIIESNWKSVYENFAINVYHEGFVHPGYKAAPNVPRVTSDGRKTYEEIDDRGYQGLRFTSTEADLAYGLPRSPMLPMKDGSSPDKHTIMSLYPNTNISVAPNYMLVTVLTPHAPDRTAYDSMMLLPSEVAHRSKYAKQREYLLTVDWAIARDEDGAVLKTVQAGRHSPAFDQHFIVPFWGAMCRSFCNRVLDDLERSEQCR